MRRRNIRRIGALIALLIVVLLVPEFAGSSADKASADSVSGTQGGDAAVSPYIPASNVVKVESEEFNTYVLRSDGTVWAWGANHHGEVGLTGIYAVKFPVKIKIPARITDISAGTAFVLALDENGDVWQWGCVGYVSSYYASCPDAQVALERVAIGEQGEKVTAISAGAYHAMALTESGEVWTWGSITFTGWGSDFYGSNTTSWTIYDLTPRRVADAEGQPLQNVKQIAGGKDFALALTGDGTAYSWGAGTSPSLGVDNGAGDLQFATPIGLEGVDSIFTSSVAQASIAVTAEGKVYGWSREGRNLGFDATPVDPLPRELPFFEGMKQFSVGDDHVLALDDNGKVWVAGNRKLGSLTYQFREFAPGLEGIERIERIFAGHSRKYLLTSELVWTAGSISSQYNLLGNGFIALSSVDTELDWTDPFLPMVELDGPPAAEHVNWERIGTRYDVEFQFPIGHYDKVILELYDEAGNRLVLEEFARSNAGLTASYSTGQLGPGLYRLEVYACNSEQGLESARTVIPLVMQSIEFTLYLYGAPDDFELVINEGTVEYVRYPGDPYDRYVFEGYPDDHFNLIAGTPGYLLSMTSLDGDAGPIYEAYVYPGNEPRIDADELEYAGGKLMGRIRWHDPETGAEDILGYRASFIGSDGSTIQDVNVEQDGGSYVVDFGDGVGIPEGSAYFQIFMDKEDGGTQPIYYKIWMEHLRLPEVALTDHHPGADRLKLDASFEGVGDESRVAFYKFVAESDYMGSAGRITALIPAGGRSYAVDLPEFELYPWERLVLYLVDKNGLTSIASAGLPVVDDMTGQIGMVPYGERYDYFFADEFGYIPGPVSSSFTDEDPWPRQLAGTVRWRREAQASNVYDIYYGDESGNVIGGLARVRQPREAPDDMEYRLGTGSGLPPGAASLVIVSIMNDIQYMSYYDPAWLVIPFDDFIDPSAVLRSALGLSPETSITLSHVASFVLRQLNAAEPVDFTGDGIFDRQDVRVLLLELDE
jgi:alpha-tubulin suppressor-like RCC1 family protein